MTSLLTIISRLLVASAGLIFAAAATAQGPVATHGARAGAVLAAMSVEEFLAIDPSDVIFGDPDAPLTIFEFSSFTCPHCGRLHTSILPFVTAEYVETGKAKIVFRDFPLDQFAVGVGLLAQCLIEPEAYYGFVEQVFAEQNAWRRSQQPFEAILDFAAQAGLSESMAQSCLESEDSLEFLMARRTLAGELIPVQGTPTLRLGTAPMDAGNIHVIRAELDAAYEAATAQ